MARDHFSSSTRDEVLSFDAQDFGSGSLSTFEKSIQVINHLPRIRERIEGPLYYHPSLLIERIDGPVKVRAVVNRDGQLRRIDESSWRGDDVLRAWVTKVLKEALGEPFLITPMESALELDLHFHFKIARDASMFTYGPDLELNTMHFYVYEVMSSPYNMTNGQILATGFKALLESKTIEERRRKIKGSF